MRIATLALLALVACGSADDEPDAPATCRSAMTHFYEAGCGYVDAESGAVRPVGDALDECYAYARTTSEPCEAELELWLECMQGVPDGADSADDCDCNAEYQALC